MRLLKRLAAEPPFRLLARELVRLFARDPRTRGEWIADPYPYYLIGLLEAAGVARGQGEAGFTAIEFGVAAGNGLVQLQRHAAAVEAVTGITIKVVGFDSGAGLPEFIGDHRDHPDLWSYGAYPMDHDALRARLDPARTTLILGIIRETLPAFIERADHPPVGFVSFDLDLYSSTRDALGIFRHPARRMLRQTPCYFDDIDFLANHRWAGEPLAIEEHNRDCADVKIDRWYSIGERPFKDAHFWTKMMVAHDLKAIDACARR